MMASLAYRAEDASIRVWVLFDGREFVAASYVCAWEDRDAEAMEAELVVRGVTLR